MPKFKQNDLCCLGKEVFQVSRMVFNHGVIKYHIFNNTRCEFVNETMLTPYVKEEVKENCVEPTVSYVTQRITEDEIHLECRMSDGQKGAFVIVDIEFPELANKITKFLNGER